MKVKARVASPSSKKASVRKCKSSEILRIIAKRVVAPDGNSFMVIESHCDNSSEILNALQEICDIHGCFCIPYDVAEELGLNPDYLIKLSEL